MDWAAEQDWEWQSAAGDTPQQLMALWQAAVQRSRSLVAAALADGGLDHLGLVARRDGSGPNLRSILGDLIEE